MRDSIRARCWIALGRLCQWSLSILRDRTGCQRAANIARSNHNMPYMLKRVGLDFHEVHTRTASSALCVELCASTRQAPLLNSPLRVPTRAPLGSGAHGRGGGQRSFLPMTTARSQIFAHLLVSRRARSMLGAEMGLAVSVACVRARGLGTCCEAGGYCLCARWRKPAPRANLYSRTYYIAGR